MLVMWSWYALLAWAHLLQPSFSTKFGHVPFTRNQRRSNSRNHVLTTLSMDHFASSNASISAWSTSFKSRVRKQNVIQFYIASSPTYGIDSSYVCG
jgi:hypothetical protein